jgi:Flp pilus assembly protein TadD
VAIGPDPGLAERAGTLVEALSAFEGLGTPESLAQARARLGQALLQWGDLERARAQFEAALALSPSSAETHAYLGHVWSLLGQNAHAEQHLQQAIALAPEHTLPRYFLGMHYLRRGWLETGRDVLVAAYEQEPDNPALCAAVADSYLRGDAPWYDVAEQWLLAAVANAPDEVAFQLLLAQLYVETGLDPGARGVEAALAAVELGPESAEAHETLGWAYHLSGQQARALEPLQRALALKESARVHYRLGEAYRVLGQINEAREQFQAAQDLDWNGAVGARAWARLAGLQ